MSMGSLIGSVFRKNPPNEKEDRSERMKNLADCIAAAIGERRNSLKTKGRWRQKNARRRVRVAHRLSTPRFIDGNQLGEKKPRARRKELYESGQKGEITI